jgi:hypothetical protein
MENRARNRESVPVAKPNAGGSPRRLLPGKEPLVNRSAQGVETTR